MIFFEMAGKLCACAIAHAHSFLARAYSGRAIRDAAQKRSNAAVLLGLVWKRPTLRLRAARSVSKLFRFHSFVLFCVPRVSGARLGIVWWVGLVYASFQEDLFGQGVFWVGLGWVLWDRLGLGLGLGEIVVNGVWGWFLSGCVLEGGDRHPSRVMCASLAVCWLVR